MKHFFFGYFIFLSFLLLPQQSFSDLYLEPYLGLGVLVRKAEPSVFKISSLKEAKEQSNSWPIIGDFYIRTALGGRVGWSKLNLTAGLDLSGSHYNNGVIIGINEKFWTILPGVFLSYQFPGFFKVYGTLIPHGFIMSTMQKKLCRIQTTDGSSCLFKTGGSPSIQNIKSEKPVIRSLKLGVSYAYTGFPFLNINLEYQPFYFTATGNTKREGFWAHGIAASISSIF